MPNYKLVDADKLEADLTTVANAIRGRGGASGNVSFPDGFVGGVQGINVQLPTLTNEGTASDLLSGKQLIDDDGNIVTGNMPNNGAISSTMDGLNTKQVTIPAGYTSGGTVSLDNTIDNEVDIQADLITQIMETLSTKSAYNTIYIGSSEPTSDIGVDGDIYIVRSGDQ